jgi:hypothetical protein
MSHTEQLGPVFPRPIDAAVAEETGNISANWPVFVVAFALSCTLAWIYLLARLLVRVVQAILA